VIGFGLSNDERAGQTSSWERAFAIARRGGLASMPHGGELLGPDHLREVVSALGPTRLGHGVRAGEDPALLDALPADSSDRTLAQALAAGFDGFFWHACGTTAGRTEHWNSLHESFSAFCTRTAVSELVQLSVSHADEAEAASWLLAAATGSALCR